jgi:hypothetical protein
MEYTNSRDGLPDCSGFVQSHLRRVFDIREHEKTITENIKSFDMMLWIGMKERQLSRMFLISSFVTAVIGVIAALALPSFLPQDPTSDSIFSLAVPFYIILLSTTLCVATGTGGTGRYNLIMCL